ncbi:MAG: hypothetical protein HY703_06515 [Gemmatimonadetes bacterium]|nr:hypothetical protein [Gemmatimonadota bacterium]
MARICLVACTRRKLDRRARAGELYTTPYFRKCRDFAVSRFDRWYILSAKHALLDPERWIDPYDVTLAGKPLRERTRWAQRVAQALARRAQPGDHVTLLAPAAYREFLVPALRQRGYRVELPLAGLRFGEQLRWLDQANRAATAS